MKFKNTEEFIKVAQEIRGNKYDYSLVNYKRMDAKVKIICPIHGEFEITPDRHLHSKFGCPFCGLKQGTKESFIQKAKEIHGDKYDYSLVDYKNNQSKIKIICPKHGLFYKSPNEHISGKAGCPVCSQEKQNEIKHNIFKKNLEDFIKEAKQVHGDKYDYSLVKYYNTHTKVKIVCPEHGLFEQTPHHHLDGSECPVCGKLKKAASRLNSWSYVLEKLKKAHGDKYDYSKSIYNGVNNKIEIICPEHGSFWMTPVNHWCGQDCPKCMIGTNTSKQEKNLGEFISSLGVKWVKTREILNGKEIDIYIPDLKIAIEYDGVYWHNNINNSYKFEECKKQGIRLIQITEWEWLFCKEKIKKYLKDTLVKHSANRFYARKCEIKEIDNITYRNFCEENHLQGYAIATIRLGLFYKDELIQIMGFSKLGQEYEYEIIRECSKQEYYIIGGKGKLLKYFEINYKPKFLISYCEKNKFSGDSYLKLGFRLDKENQSDYNYYKGKQKLSRQDCQKSLFETFDENLSEWENMSNNGYMRLFDYGNYVFIKEYKYD